MFLHLADFKYWLDAEASCVRKIDTRGAVECGNSWPLPTCPEGFNFM